MLSESSAWRFGAFTGASGGLVCVFPPPSSNWSALLKDWNLSVLVCVRFRLIAGKALLSILSTRVNCFGDPVFAGRHLAQSAFLLYDLMLLFGCLA